MSTPPPTRERPLASVVIVTYNSRRYLRRCLEAVLRQSYPRFEILVIDNASSDGSADEIALHFPDINLLRMDQNLGFAGANNLAFALTRGEYVALLNPDTEAEPGWLEALVTALEADPSAGLATSKIVLFDQRDRINACGNDVHFTGLAFCRGLCRPVDAYTAIEEVSAVSGAAFLVRRCLLEELGGFSTPFFMYLEDTDLSWRAALAGYRSILVPYSVVYHHYAVRISPTKAFYLERNRHMMLLQNYQAATLVLLLPALLLAEFVTWGFALLRGPRMVAAKARAYLWVARHLSEIRRRRQSVQRSRRVDDRVILRRFGYRLALEQVAAGGLLAIMRPLLDIPFLAWYRTALMVAGKP